VAINHQNRPELEKLPFLVELLPPDIRAEMEAIRIAPLDELTDLYHWFHKTWHGAAAWVAPARRCGAVDRWQHDNQD
jgi:hypothetical protein